MFSDELYPHDAVTIRRIFGVRLKKLHHYYLELIYISPDQGYETPCTKSSGNQ